MRSLQRPFTAGALGGSALAMVTVWALRPTNLMLDLPPADPLGSGAAIVCCSTRQ